MGLLLGLLELADAKAHGISYRGDVALLDRIGAETDPRLAELNLGWSRLGRPWPRVLEDRLCRGVSQRSRRSFALDGVAGSREVLARRDAQNPALGSRQDRPAKALVRQHPG